MGPLGPDGEISTTPCNDGWREAEQTRALNQVAAGERRWYDSVENLPKVFDGGCIFIEINYDVEAHAVISVRCNGTA